MKVVLQINKKSTVYIIFSCVVEHLSLDPIRLYLLVAFSSYTTYTDFKIHKSKKQIKVPIFDVQRSFLI